MIRTEGIKGGGGRVGAGDDDMGDGMQCSNHPHRNNPGGICAFCLQEKLGKLVSSSFPLPVRPSSSSSSSPSFRSDMAPASAACAAPSSSSLSFSARPVSAVKNGIADSQYNQYYTRRVRLPFLLARKNKKASSNSSSSAAPSSASDVIFKRSKSSATPRMGKFLNDAEDDDIVIENFSPRKRNGFWSFLYLPSKSSAPAKKSGTKSFRDSRNSPRISTITPAITGSSSVKQKDKFLGSNLGRKIEIGGKEDDSPNSQTTASASSFERKVSRSRSVGCGSRSFSGDFFERISTGFGDCTLRRVESQREGKSRAMAASSVVNHHHHPCMKERVKCAGIFSGLMMTSSSSSSSSSSYWVSSSADDHGNGKSAAVAISHGRARSWGWAFASPMRAFSTKSKRDIIRDASDHKNATTPKPNLSDIPSLLAVGV
ncbi:uncharacterized serine-rich protein C215.13-like [Neltuma alba]|uniref:uncharacterized serine-rich protein C215.13-like n=1 Tax=Neltuma alba TaxID=207710 RepID=UPI0010A395F0|nr:uncharacterized serine-rich protein C215.13-like [Prosopis alba]